MKLLAFTVLAVAASAWAACGPYSREESTDKAEPYGILALETCAAPTALVSPDDNTPLAGITPEAADGSSPIACATPEKSPKPAVTATASAIASVDTPSPAAATQTAVPVLVTNTPSPVPSTETPTPTQPVADETIAAYTATARAERSIAYLSFGDGIQWGCCGNLGQSASSLFSDYLRQRIGRPVMGQTSGAGYETTDTYLHGIGGAQPQIDFSIELLNYYRREGIPVAAITMSIGGNNLVEIGRSCAQPPCTDAYVAGIAHLREQLTEIYSRITDAKDPDTPLMVLLYYDANECTNPQSGAAVDGWNAVIAEVASQYGAFLVDARSAFRGHCDWIDPDGLDPNVAGHRAIADAYQRVYESLPPLYIVGP